MRFPTRLSLLTLAASMGLATFVSAAAFTSGYLDRRWDESGQGMTEYLTFQTSQGAMNMVVRMDIYGDAPLRAGERESFRVDAQLQEVGGQPSSVWITVDPDEAYYDYPYISRNFPIFNNFPTVFIDTGHGGRAEVGAAPSFSDVGVAHTGTDQPVTLSFEDFAFAENGAVATEYSFAFYRRSFLSKPKLVAQGLVPRSGEGQQSIVITKDGEYAAAGKEWFKAGKSYWIVLRMKRQGSEHYTDELGADLVRRFTWNKRAGSMATKAALRSDPDRGLHDHRGSFLRLHR